MPLLSPPHPHPNRTTRTTLAAAVAACGVTAALLLPGSAQAADPAQITGVGSALCIDVPRSDATNGNPVTLWTCNGGANQHVTLTAAGQLAVLGKCLDAQAWGRTPGTKVILWDCTGGANQQWKHDGTRIIGVNSGLCLDAYRKATTNSTPLVIWTCNGGSNQQWSLYSASNSVVPSSPATATATATAPAPPAPVPSSSGTLDARFRGMNWADPGDNFQQGNIVPNGLQVGESPATSYATASRVFTSFKTNFQSNTVRLAINPATVSGAWWANYTQVIKAANDLGMNVVLGNWGPQSSQFAIPDMTAFHTMWDRVVTQYRTNTSVYFEPFNEPGNQGNWVSVAEDFVGRYASLDRGRIFIDGTGWAENAAPIGDDAKLAGTVISIHVYSLFGRSHTTYDDWVADFSQSISSYGSRIVVTEFGVPARNGVDYDGARDGDNNRSYFYAVTDLIRSHDMGTIYWEGVNPRDGLSLESADSSYTTFTVNSRSALDRLMWAWHLS